MTSSDIIRTIIKDRQFVCFKCKKPVDDVRMQVVRGHSMLTFTCHGDQEHVPVPIAQMWSVALAKKCHGLLDTLVPFAPFAEALPQSVICLPDSDPELPSGQPRLASEAAPAARLMEK